MKKIDLFKSVCKIRVFFDNLNKFRLQKQQKLLCYHANVSEYHQFIDYLEEKQLAFAFKSKLTSVWGQNYFEFMFGRKMLMHWRIVTGMDGKSMYVWWTAWKCTVWALLRTITSMWGITEVEDVPISFGGMSPSRLILKWIGKLARPMTLM